MGTCTSSSKSNAGGSTTAKSQLYTEDKNGVRVYDTDNEEAGKAFISLSDNFINFSKQAAVTKGDAEPVMVKKNSLGEYLKSNNINEMRIDTEKGMAARNLKTLKDYGFEVIAKTKTDAVNPWDIEQYYVSKKKMTRMNLDMTVGTYYKRGEKG